ncbi:type 1 glutamine amidotransferase [Streptomyces sp. NPDC047072]|uniref:type 1 glutamine amidotransferase n=1 Tax=Streptomyces sp. NPDC047072 TaxID=3154809 RepID=UPI0033D91D24
MRALVVQHDHMTEPGLVGARLVERGYDLTVLTVVPEDRHRTPDVTFDFPDAADWDLVVSLGAPWSVYDESAVGSWMGGELALLRKAHHLGVPVLGVCFGAQALTTALGGSVEPAPRPEIGWVEVDTDDPSLVGPGPWFQWHYDHCLLPPDAVEVARNAVCAQAFRVGRSLGVQFHPEITTGMVGGWLAAGGAEQCVRQGIDPGELLDRSRAMEPVAGANARRLVDAFLDRVAGGSLSRRPCRG